MALSQLLLRPVRSVGRRHALASGLVALLLLVGVGPLSPPGSAQDIQTRELLRRLERMESTMQDVQREVFRAGGRGGTSTRTQREASSASGGGGGSEVRISEIEQVMSGLTAEIELVVHRLDVMEERLDKLVADIDFRLSQIERNLSVLVEREGVVVPPATAAAPQAPAAVETEPAGTRTAATSGVESEAAPRAGVLPEGSAKERYAFAMGLLTRLDYVSAEIAFSEFLKLHSDHELAGNAQYWLGETYYVRQNYAEAATAFIEGYQKFPEGTKAPDNLLKLGMSLAALDQKTDACATFAELLSRFTDAPNNISRRATQEQSRLSC